MVVNPSCRQTTVASLVPHKSSHTVPHTLLLQYSTRPSVGMLPLTSLTSPVGPVCGKISIIVHDSENVAIYCVCIDVNLLSGHKHYSTHHIVIIGYTALQQDDFQLYQHATLE